VQAREAVRVMLTTGGGAIVSVASVSSVVAFPTQAAYAASKGAIAQLTRVIAVEYGTQNIRANAVLPGVVNTDIMEVSSTTVERCSPPSAANTPSAGSGNPTKSPKSSPSWPAPPPAS